ncbi:MAG: hypothetical protein H6Q73_1064 [Firmicutes bacterium]|nr:hypothetical protein [Bacillota bacterium]
MQNIAHENLLYIAATLTAALINNGKVCFSQPGEPSSDLLKHHAADAAQAFCEIYNALDTKLNPK